MSPPALDIINKDLYALLGLQTSHIMSIFLLAYSFGSLVLSPCSEIWDRERIVQCRDSRGMERSWLTLESWLGLGGSAYRLLGRLEEGGCELMSRQIGSCSGRLRSRYRWGRASRG